MTEDLRRFGIGLLAAGLTLLGGEPVEASARRFKDLEVVYDADGHRVLERRTWVDSDTGAESTEERRILVDPLHPSGFSEVAACLEGGAISRIALGGVHPVAEWTSGGQDARDAALLLHDGAGSTRAVLELDPAGEGVQRFSRTSDFEAFGKELELEGTGEIRDLAPSIGFRGEEFSRELGALDLRARWYGPGSGRFHTGDAFEGVPEEPGSSHRYLYAAGDPVNRLDPSGYFTLLEIDLVQKVQASVRTVEAQSPRAALQAAKAKAWDVYLGISLRPFSKTPLHSAVFAESLITREGVRYEVGIRGSKPLLGSSLGAIRRRRGSLEVFKRQSTWHFKAARLNTLQFVGWDRAIGFLEVDDSIIPVDYSVFGFSIMGPGPTNCTAWALEAALAAWAASKVAN